LLRAALLAGATAFDTEAPIISLNLDDVRSPYKLANRIEHTTATNQHGESVTSYQDFSVRCAAGTATNTDCPAPTATAYDHHEGSLPTCTEGEAHTCLKTRLYLVNSKAAAVEGIEQPDVPCTTDCEVDATAGPDYTLRSTYLYKFDAKDSSGNRAEQVVFALILDDLHAPEIFYQGADASCANVQPLQQDSSCFPVLANQQIVESSSSWGLPASSKAVDAIDGDVDDTLLYKVEFLNPSDDVYRARELLDTSVIDCIAANINDCYFSYDVAKQLIDASEMCSHIDLDLDSAGESTCETSPACRYRITLKANDYASIYGHGGANNIRTHSVHLTIKDTRAPVIQIQGATPMIIECNAVNTEYSYGEKNAAGSYDEVVGYVVGSTSCANGMHDFCASGAEVIDLHDTISFSRTIDYKVEYSGTYNPGNWGCVDEACVAAASAVNPELALDGASKLRGSLTRSMTPLPIGDVGSYLVHFSASDYACNEATSPVREVYVQDTIKPELQLQGDSTVTVDFNAEDLGGLEDVMTGVVCSDTCSESFVRITDSWDRTYSAGEKGTFVQTYTCYDHEGNSDNISRTYIVEDNSVPIISMNGLSDVTLEASIDAEYSDEGATCSDHFDGQIDHQVTIHGDVVNYRVPGTYTIKFDCEDSSSNDAIRRERTVVITDTECPLVTLLGGSTLTIEAGFPYEDAHATATDTLDGDITNKITSTGGPLDSHFNYETSCKAILTKEPLATSGNYNILTTVNGHQQFLHVYCDMDLAATFFIHHGHMIFHDEISESELIVPYGTNQGACTAYGMKMAEFTADLEDAAVQYAQNIDGGRCADCVEGAAQIDGLWRFSSTTQTTSYFCEPLSDTGSESPYSEGGLANIASRHTDDHSNHRRTGTFIVTYRVRDADGNGWSSTGCTGSIQCCESSQKKRSIIVQDTLPPVITLTLNDQLIHKSYGGQRGINNVENPANFAGNTTVYHSSGAGHHNHDINGNPFLTQENESDGEPSLLDKSKLMAESSTPVNGWVIGAVASAVTGVALLGYSMRASEATSIPV